MRGVIQTSRRRQLILIVSDLGQDTHETLQSLVKIRVEFHEISGY